MTDYRVEWNQPIHNKYRDFELWTIPAPASGAIWLNTMSVLGEFEGEESGSVTDLHRLTEALRVSLFTLYIVQCLKLMQARIRNSYPAWRSTLCFRIGRSSTEMDFT